MWPKITIFVNACQGSWPALNSQNFHICKVLNRTINFELPHILCFKNAFPLDNEWDRYILNGLIAAANAVGEPDIVERLLSNDSEYH